MNPTPNEVPELLPPCPLCKQPPERRRTPAALRGIYNRDEAVCRTDGCLIQGIWFAENRWNAATRAPLPASGPTEHCADCDPSFLECWNDGSKCRKSIVAPPVPSGGAAEHNPDGLTPEQYGAPEWRLLREGEIIQTGDEYWQGPSKNPWEIVSVTGGLHGWRCDDYCTFRRRVAPAPAPMGEIARLKAEVESLKQRWNNLDIQYSAKCAELAAAREDSARVNKLEARGRGGCLLELCCDKFTGKWTIGVGDEPHDTLRAAIDAAKPEDRV